MNDDRVIMMSESGCSKQLRDGKGLHWCCNIDEELPIKMRKSGPGSEKPITLGQLFINAVQNGEDKPALWVERNEKKLLWSWN